VNQLLIQYAYLQFLDLITTIAFLLQGVQEGNPLVNLALRYVPFPLGGLVVMKIAAIALGVYAWRRGREKLLVRINILFALVVAWNIVSLILASAVPHAV
jgi:Domain of unknown function (DUF5658)